MTYDELQGKISELTKIVDTLKLANEVKKAPGRAQLMPLIEHQLDIPAPGPKPKYPWKTMQKGQSFLVKCEDTREAREKVMNSLTSCIANARRRYRRDFIQRRDPEGMRVWRIA